MKKTKLNLENLHVKSFTTAIQDADVLKGGTSVIIIQGVTVIAFGKNVCEDQEEEQLS